MEQKNTARTVLPYPRERQLMVDGGRMGLQKHTIHGLVEFDVTRARESIREYRKQTGEALSFSTFFLSCLGKAIDQDRQLHAYRDWRNQLILFDEVDVNMLFEVEVDGKKAIRPHIMRGVNRKSVGELQEEIQAFQAGHQSSRESRFITWFVRLPAFARRFFLWVLFKNPQLIKDYYGTVLLSSVGMFGSGSGWGIPVPNHSLQLTLGGMCEKPGVVNHRIEPRMFMNVTISFDHDVIDGAPAARFIQRLKKLVENGLTLDNQNISKRINRRLIPGTPKWDKERSNWNGDLTRQSLYNPFLYQANRICIIFLNDRHTEYSQYIQSLGSSLQNTSVNLNKLALPWMQFKRIIHA